MQLLKTLCLIALTAGFFLVAVITAMQAITLAWIASFPEHAPGFDAFERQFWIYSTLAVFFLVIDLGLLIRLVEKAKAKRWLKITAVAVCGSFILWVGINASNFIFGDVGKVRIVNMATESVATGRIEILDQQMTFSNLARGREKNFHFYVVSDAHYDVTIEFVSGKKLVRELGYLTNGSDYDETIVIEDDYIILTIPE